MPAPTAETNDEVSFLVSRNEGATRLDVTIDKRTDMLRYTLVVEIDPRAPDYRIWTDLDQELREA